MSWDSLCNLYNWRYKNLGNLPHVQLLPEFSTANAGLLYDFQLINVEDFQGVGESEPNPYFYQVTPRDTGVCLAFAWLKYLEFSNTESCRQPLRKRKVTTSPYHTNAVSFRRVEDAQRITKNSVESTKANIDKYVVMW